MDKISKAETEAPPGINNFGARQFEYAFVKRLPSSPPRGKSASSFLKCVCKKSYCVGSISCVGCVAQLRKTLRTPELRQVLRTASSTPLRIPQLRPVASPLRQCASSSCASPIALPSRSLRISRRAATAMKVKRTAERLAHLVAVHQRALVELSKLCVPRLVPVASNVASPVASSASGELRPECPRPCELRPGLSNAPSIGPVVKRESPLRQFASVASKYASKSQSVASPVVSLRPPKRSLH
jgi:hypothetical protein